jgi:asparagine synthase (glutamine-hydrolysing)
VFGEISNVAAAVDHVHYHKFGAGFADVVHSTARLTKKTAGSVALRSLRGLWRRYPARNSLSEASQQSKLLGPAAFEAARMPNPFTPCWLPESETVPPGKALHILMLARPNALASPMARDDDPERAFPLASQPIMELSLSIPVPVLTRGGRTRSVARSAFVDDVPREILMRRTKGSPQGLVSAMVERNLPFLRERLLDGWLVKNNVLDRRKVADALSQSERRVPSEILFHLCTEIWLERVAQRI